MESEKPARRSAHRTQWAAQFAVASELCKRGYEVAFTMGNHPSVDLMVTSPKQHSFGIDVKGLYKPNFWSVREKPIRFGLFYVFAYVPDGEPNRFFILSQAQVNAEIASVIESVRRRALEQGRSDAKAEAFPGVGWRFAAQFEDQWGALPD